MRVHIIGAGSVGLSLGGRLARAGESVCFTVRDPDVALALAERGVDVEDPSTGSQFHADGAAIANFECEPSTVEHSVHVFCTRAPDLRDAARALRAVVPAAFVVSAQNGVESEAELSRHFEDVAGLVYRQTCTRTSPTSVNALGAGRVVVGAYRGSDRTGQMGQTDGMERLGRLGRSGRAGGEQESVAPRVDALVCALRRAGYDVGVSDCIERDKWLKLCINLMSVPNALIRREDHESPDFVAVKVGILEEALAVSRAAGLEATSCDGRDRDLEAEIAHQRGALARGASARPLPLYNAVWTAFARGAALEADRYHTRILDLAASYGVPAPLNARALEVARQCFRDGSGPECLRATEFLTD